MPDSEPLKADSAHRLILALDGFEGPLDLLLDLARTQKVDLARISITALVDQYLAVIEDARRIRLELAADWLVMAAWLAWLKSRLLLPADKVEAVEAERAAEDLAERLRELEIMRSLAAWLNARPLLDHDVFARGAPEDFTEIDRSGLKVDLASLLAAYLAARRRGSSGRGYQPKPMRYWSVQQALERLSRLLPISADWHTLEQFMPPQADDAELPDPLAHRAALSSTLLAGLELARNGAISLQQEAPFGPIRLRRAEEPRAHD
jgi:segregation and condensation protein A